MMSKKTKFSGLLRRTTGGALAAVIAMASGWAAMPASAAEVLRVGVPTNLTGAAGSIGQDAVDEMNYWAERVNAAGGILGQQVEFVVRDTQGQPANAVRLTKEMVEKDGIKVFLGIVRSSEAIAVSAKLEEWGAIHISSINGSGALTSTEYSPNFFRANTTGPMGARVVAAYLKAADLDSFFAMGEDYSWGRGSVAAFKENIAAIGKEYTGEVFVPSGTTDFSTYITKVRRAGSDGLYVALAGATANTFFEQAAQFRLSDQMQLLTELVNMSALSASPEGTEGLVGGMRYVYSFDTDANNAYVKAFKAKFGKLPNTWHGETEQALQFLQAAIEKAGSTDIEAIKAAMSDLTIDTLKGHLTMRACDNQATNPGIIVQAKTVEGSGFDHPVPVVLSVIPPEQATPACRKSN